MKDLRYIFILFVLLGTLNINAQSAKDEHEIIERTQMLSKTVFGTKDSLTLEDLFAKQATYGHSHGNLQTRSEAINGISHNKSTYIDTAVSKISVLINEKTAIVRHLFKANEVKTDGKIVPLNFTMMLVWVKEHHKWRLFGRQAVAL